MSPIYFYDTYLLAKSLMHVKAAREDLCKIFDINSEENHNALSDACDCLNIFCNLNSEYNVISTIKPQLYDFSTIKRNSSSEYGQKIRLTMAEIAATTIYEEPDLDFKGKKFVVTGDFQKFKKTREVEEEIYKRGGERKTKVTNNVDLLICGDKNPGQKKYKPPKNYI